MAIIYSYPQKSAALTDNVLISDSTSNSPKQQTKQASISSIKDIILPSDNVTGSGTTSTIPKWSGSNTLTDSVIKDQGGVDVLIPRFIKHDGDTNNLFGFSDVGKFLVSVDSTAEDQFEVDAEAITMKTDSGIKLSAGPAQVALYNDENGSTTATKASLVTYDSGITVRGGTENSFSRGGGVRFFTSTNNSYVGIVGPTTNGTAYEIILPNAVGTASQVLKLPSTIGTSPYQLVWGDGGSGGSSYQAGNGIDINTSTTPETLNTGLLSNGGLVFDTAKMKVNLAATAMEGELRAVDGGTGLSLSTTASFSALMGTGDDSFSQSKDIDTALKLPEGATNRRPTPSEANAGMIRYNSETANLEVSKQTTQSSGVYSWYIISGLTIISG